MIYNVGLISAVQENDSVICICTFFLKNILSHCGLSYNTFFSPSPQCIFFFLFSKSILKEQMVSGSEHLCSLPLTKEELVSETKQRLSKKEMEMSEIRRVYCS